MHVCSKSVYHQKQFCEMYIMFDVFKASFLLLFSLGICFLNKRKEKRTAQKGLFLELCTLQSKPDCDLKQSEVQNACAESTKGVS